MRRLCSICARGGSKGVPSKNVRPMLGRPLVAHSVEQALATGLFDEIAISSDSPAILDAAMAAGATLRVERPAELATDTAAKPAAILHCAQAAERMTGQRFDLFCDLDATAPLREPRHIAEAMAMVESGAAGNVISVCPARRSPYFNMVELGPDGVPRLSKRTDPPIVRRQDAPPVFDLNASIYVWRRDALFDTGAAIFTEALRLYVMPEHTAWDIDSEIDLAVVEFLLTQRERFHGK